MIDIKEKPQKVEKAFLIGIYFKKASVQQAQYLLDELVELTTTLKIPIVGSKLVHISAANSSFLVGKGKAQELADEISLCGADVIIFDEILTPAQQKNWEEKTKILVIDRCEVILDIFAERAQTKEAKLQVELARAKYNLPRLTRAWTHLSRQRGGTNLRGEGERQIEVDRRLVRKKITRLEKELVKVRQRRETQRKKRAKKPVPNVAIIGYTNAGKSSLINKLTKAETLADDLLFATLDPTTKKIELSNNQELLLTDTVGFIRKLPHNLIEAFKSTLEEACLADFLINVIDSSNPEMGEHIKTTMEVLKELGAENKRIITVFNKIDIADKKQYEKLFYQCDEPMALSVHTGEGIEELYCRLSDILSKCLLNKKYRFHMKNYGIFTNLYEEAQILSQEYEGEYLIIEAKVPAILSEKIAQYEIA